MVTVHTPANSNTAEPDLPGGERRMSATLARAEAAVAHLARDYATWALEDVAKAAKALATAKADAAARPAQVEALFRVAHDLKGQGSSFGYPLVTKIGHSLCALTRDRALTYQDEHLDLAQAHVDAIQLVLTKGIKGDGGKVGAELVARLEQRVAELVA
jgi:chemotaxis protein histidine kinase CheA